MGGGTGGKGGGDWGDMYFILSCFACYIDIPISEITFLYSIFFETSTLVLSSRIFKLCRVIRKSTSQLLLLQIVLFRNGQWLNYVWIRLGIKTLVYYVYYIYHIYIKTRYSRVCSSTAFTLHEATVLGLHNAIIASGSRHKV